MTNSTVRIVVPGADYRDANVGYSGPALLLEGATQLLAAYSTRRINPLYTGPLIRMIRSSDSAEQDFGPDIFGWVDIEAVIDWLDGANGFITKWYDQSLNARNQIQQNATYRPTLNATGINGHPSISMIAQSMTFTGIVSFEAISFLQVSKTSARGNHCMWNARTAAFFQRSSDGADYLNGDYQFYGTSTNSGVAPRYISTGGQDSVPTAREIFTGSLGAGGASLRKNSADMTPRVDTAGAIAPSSSATYLAVGHATGNSATNLVQGMQFGDLVLFSKEITDFSTYESAMAESWAA